MEASNHDFLDYEEKISSTYGFFLDVVNLYGSTMTMKMPVSNFKWTRKSLQDLLNTPDDANEVYSVMVDIEYPYSRHDKHNNFPLAAEKLKIEKNFLSVYQKKFNCNKTKTEKLMKTLLDKVCHLVMRVTILFSSFFVGQGLKITKVSKVLQFHQSNFLKPYIDVSIRMRQEPRISDFERTFNKFLMNSCFGKTIENLRRRKNLMKVANEQQVEFFVINSIATKSRSSKKICLQ